MHAYTYQLDDSEDKSTKLLLCIPDSLKLMFGAHGGRKELNLKSILHTYIVAHSFLHSYVLVLTILK